MLSLSMVSMIGVCYKGDVRRITVGCAKIIGTGLCGVWESVSMRGVVLLIYFDLALSLCLYLYHLNLQS